MSIRKISSDELASKIGNTPANLSILKTNILLFNQYEYKVKDNDNRII